MLSGDIAAGARTHIDNEWLAEGGSELLPDHARRQIRDRTGGKAHDDAYRFGWIGGRRHRRRDKKPKRQCGTGKVLDFQSIPPHRIGSQLDYGL